MSLWCLLGYTYRIFFGRWSHNYPSYTYHVVDRAQTGFSVWNLPSFILGQLVIFGPLVAPLLFYSAFKAKSNDQFSRTLKYNLFGILFFFLLSSIRSKVEPNWTLPILIPLVILTMTTLRQYEKLKKRTVSLALVSAAVLIIPRIHLVIPILPAGLDKKSEFHGWDNWAKSIQNLADGKPVVFVNSYQKAAKYYFYSGDEAFSLNNVMYRRNQYDLWRMADKVQGETILMSMNWDWEAFA